MKISSNIYIRIGIALGSMGMYAVIFPILYPVAGPATAALNFIPMVVVGWLLGIRGVLLFGVLNIPLNILLFYLQGDSTTAENFAAALIANSAIILIGMAVAWVRELLDRIRSQTEKLRDEQKILQEEVEKRIRAEERYHTLFDRIPAALYRTSPQGQILDANPALVELLGYPDCETLSKVNVSEFYIDPKDRIIENNLLAQEGVVRGVEFEIRRFDGRVVTVKDTSRIVRDANNDTVIYYEGSLEDITAYKQAEEARRQSEQMFSVIFEKAPFAATLSGLPDGTIEVANEKFEKLFGYSRQEAIGRTSLDLGIYTDPAARKRSSHKIQEQGFWHNVELKLRTKSGNVRDFMVNMDFIEHGGKKHILTTAQDVTELKQAEEALRKSQETYQKLFESNPHPMWVYDVESLAFLMVNDFAVECYGYSREEFMGMTIKDIRPREDVPALLDNLEQASPSLEKSSGWRHVKKDGTVIDVEITSHAIQFGERPARLVLASDITERKQYEEELHALNAELEQRVAKRTEELSQTNIELEHANRAKDEFLANMSHELRTPLNSILGLSESLLEQKRGTLNDHQQTSLQIIESSGRHLLELINDVLDLSKIEAGMLDYYPQMVEVNSLCRSSLVFIKEQAIRKGIDIEYEENKSVSTIYADPRRLKQILINLLTNAVKFTPERGRVTLQVHTDADNDLVQFTIIDNGIGIAPEDLKRLFQPFVQVDSSLNRKFEGTGLGLALVQKLTDLHGGSVHVESEAGVGSRFTIHIPWGRQRVEKQGIIESDREPLKSDKSHLPSEKPVEPGTILLAEDNMANILTIGEYLESHGYKVVTAHDGWETILQAEEIDPDIILMDIQMPVMDGLEATRHLRKNPRFASTPIIALTALAMPGDRERCLEAGANEYMSKPVSLKGLMKTINNLLHAEVYINQ